jgi:hypothetical protein
MRNLILLAAFTATASWAQVNVISAKAGLVHHAEGDFTIDGATPPMKVSHYAELRNQSVLATAEGRAEILLAPGSFARLGPSASMKMLDNSLTATRLELSAGQMVLEVGDLDKDSSIGVRVGEAWVIARRKGVYSISMDAAKVYDGELSITKGEETVVIRTGKMYQFAGSVAKFDKEQGDELLRWARRRSEYTSIASISAANSLYTRGLGMNAGGWVFNPYFGMMTFIPARGLYRSPWGFSYFGPQAAYQAVVRQSYQPDFNTAGYATGYGGYSGTGVNSPSWNSSYGYNTTDVRSSGGYTGGYSGSSGAGSYSGGGMSGGGAAAASGGGDSGVRGGGASGGASGGGAASGGNRGN